MVGHMFNAFKLLMVQVPFRINYLNVVICLKSSLLKTALGGNQALFFWEKSTLAGLKLKSAKRTQKKQGKDAEQDTTNKCFVYLKHNRNASRA